MNKQVAEFVIYIIHEVANRDGVPPSQVYRKLDETGCIAQYLVPFYDVLHTMGSDSIVQDVVEFVKLRGVTI